MIRPEYVPDLIGGTVRDSAGERLGQTLELLFDDDGTPTWAAVREGEVTRLLPLRDARAEGSDIVVDYGRDLVDRAPDVALGGAGLAAADEQVLWAHYGGQRTTAGSVGTTTGSPSVIRSEERLVAGVETVVAARARLQKYVVTETRTVTVEVRKEMARLVYDEEIAESSGSVASEHAFEPTEKVFVLYEEEPVVTTRTVPYAQARLVTELETTQVPVTREIRREQVTALTLPAG